MNKGRLLIATFCDDIRYERGNKYSLMGCYSVQLILELLPSTMPKLCVEIAALTPLENPFTKLTLRAMLDDEIIGEIDLAGENLGAMQKIIIEKANSDATQLELRSHMIFSPLVLLQPGTLRVEAETEEGVIKGSKLTIRARNSDDKLD